MTAGLGMAAAIRVQASVAELDAAYRREVQWAQGLRTNPDVRLVLLAAERLIGSLGRDALDRAQTGIVLGSQYGSMASYEDFAAGLAAGGAPPLAFSHAIPSAPVAGLSIRFGLKGPVLALSGGAEVGLTAMRRASMLLAAGRCDRVLAGCWHVPSETALAAGQPERADAVLVMLTGRGGRQPSPPVAGPCLGTCTDRLQEWIQGTEEAAGG